MRLAFCFLRQCCFANTRAFSGTHIDFNLHHIFIARHKSNTNLLTDLATSTLKVLNTIYFYTRHEDKHINTHKTNKRASVGLHYRQSTDLVSYVLISCSHLWPADSSCHTNLEMRTVVCCLKGHYCLIVFGSGIFLILSGRSFSGLCLFYVVFRCCFLCCCASDFGWKCASKCRFWRSPLFDSWNVLFKSIFKWPS